MARLGPVRLPRLAAPAPCRRQGSVHLAWRAVTGLRSVPSPGDRHTAHGAWSPSPARHTGPQPGQAYGAAPPVRVRSPALACGGDPDLAWRRPPAWASSRKPSPGRQGPEPRQAHPRGLVGSRKPSPVGRRGPSLGRRPDPRPRSAAGTPAPAGRRSPSLPRRPVPGPRQAPGPRPPHARASRAPAGARARAFSPTSRPPSAGVRATASSRARKPVLGRRTEAPPRQAQRLPTPRPRCGPRPTACGTRRRGPPAGTCALRRSPAVPA